MRYILGLILLISGSSLANTGSGNVSNVYNLGGFTGTNVGGTPISVPPATIIPEGNMTFQGQSVYKTLIGTNVNIVALSYNQFFDSSAASGVQYQVPAGKIFLVTQICWVQSSATGTTFTPGSATAVWTNGTQTPPTGVKYWGSNSAPGAATGGVFTVAGSPTNGVGTGCINLNTSFASGTYPFWEQVVTSTVAGTVWMIGKEI